MSFWVTLLTKCLVNSFIFLRLSWLQLSLQVEFTKFHCVLTTLFIIHLPWLRLAFLASRSPLFSVSNSLFLQFFVLLYLVHLVFLYIYLSCQFHFQCYYKNCGTTSSSLFSWQSSDQTRFFKFLCIFLKFLTLALHLLLPDWTKSLWFHTQTLLTSVSREFPV